MKHLKVDVILYLLKNRGLISFGNSDDDTLGNTNYSPGQSAQRILNNICGKCVNNQEGRLLRFSGICTSCSILDILSLSVQQPCLWLASKICRISLPIALGQFSPASLALSFLTKFSPYLGGSYRATYLCLWCFYQLSISFLGFPLFLLSSCWDTSSLSY